MLTHETLINYEKPFINKCVIKVLYGDKKNVPSPRRLTCLSCILSTWLAASYGLHTIRKLDKISHILDFKLTLNECFNPKLKQKNIELHCYFINCWKKSGFKISSC